MEAYRIDRFGSVNGIVLRSSEDPRAGPKEVLMRVRASSLNYRDLMVLKGGGRGPTKLGVVPLSDGAGKVAAVGDGGTRVKLGDRIIGTFHPRWFGGPLSADYLTDRLGANLQISEFPTGDFGSNRQAVSGETDRPFRSKGARRCGVVSVPALANRRCGVDAILLWSVQASTLVSIIDFGDCGRL